MLAITQGIMHSSSSVVFFGDTHSKYNYSNDVKFIDELYKWYDEKYNKLYYPN